jgi:uncharacterized protein YdeI (YjbR/CyaY-like superfamily)
VTVRRLDVRRCRGAERVQALAAPLGTRAGSRPAPFAVHIVVSASDRAEFTLDRSAVWVREHTGPQTLDDPTCGVDRVLSVVTGRLGDMPTESPSELPTLSFATADEFADWLAEQHAHAAGLWLKIAKKSASTPTLDYAGALEVALCWGWIDGQKKSLDETHWLQRFTPRSARSKWSRINRDKAEALIASGHMQPPGLAQVDKAKSDGRWAAAYEGARSASVPHDLAAALTKDPRAAAFFETLDSRNRYAILYRVQDAKRPQTRAARIEKYVAMLAQSERIHPTQAE